MMRTRRAVLSTGVGVLCAATMAGCLGDDDPGDSDDTHEDAGDDLPVADEFFDTIGIYELQLVDRRHDPHEDLSYMHGNHWHASGSFPMVPLGDTLSIGARAYDEDGNELDLWDDYELKAAVSPPADESVVSVDFHGDHVQLHGEEAGLTELVFIIWHNGHADYQSEPIAVQVGEDHHDDDHHDDDHHDDDHHDDDHHDDDHHDDDHHDDNHHDDDHHDDGFGGHAVANVSILDRAHDPHEEVADWHDGHWQGSVPPVPVGSHVSIGAIITDDAGNEADLEDEYELRVRLADDAPDVVTFDSHGDHVHIRGEEVGETQVVFQLWHDDHADFETDPIDVTVTDEQDDDAETA